MPDPVFPVEVSAIIGVDDVAESFTIQGDKTASLVTDRGLVIIGSTGNDGTYTIVSSSYAAGPNETTVVVVEDVTDNTVDGTMLYASVAPYPRSKVSQFTESTAMADEDLFYISEAQDPSGYISKYLKWVSMKTQNDDRYILKSDVFLNLNIPALIIRK